MRHLPLGFLAGVELNCFSATDPMHPPHDCQRCGVCCFSESAEYVWVMGYDWTRLGEDADRLAHFIGNRAFMRMTEGHCTALAIRQVPGEETVFSCTIYDRRPEICRALERGSPECLGDLETKAAQVAAITGPLLRPDDSPAAQRAVDAPGFSGI